MRACALYAVGDRGAAVDNDEYTEDNGQQILNDIRIDYAEQSREQQGDT